MPGSLGCLAIVACIALAILPIHATAPATYVSVAPKETPGERLVPEGPVREWVFEWRYSVSMQGQGALSPTGETTIHWTIACEDPGIRVTGPRSTQVQIQRDQLHTTGTIAFNVSADRLARGLQPIPCELQGQADGSGPALPPSEGSVPFHVTVGYQGLLQLQAPSRQVETGPGGTVALDIVVHAFSNAPTKAVLHVEGLADGWSADVPDPILLEPGQNETVVVTLHAPHGSLWTSLGSQFMLKATPHAEADETQVGEAEALEVLARARGVQPVSWGGGLLLVALVGAAVGLVFLRRRLGRGKGK